jgi:hypothetical protein
MALWRETGLEAEKLPSSYDPVRLRYPRLDESTALITARWEARARRRNQRLAAQRQREKSCGFRDGLNLSPDHRLRAIRPGQ